MTFPIAKPGIAAGLLRQQVPDAPITEAKEEGMIFQRALLSSRRCGAPLAENESVQSRDVTGQENHALPSFMSSPPLSPSVRTSIRQEQTGSILAPATVPMTSIISTGKAAGAGNAPSAPDFTSLLSRMDANLPGSARSEVHLPGDQWIARNITLEETQNGLLLNMDLRKENQSRDAINELLKRLRARGIAVRIGSEEKSLGEYPVNEQ